MEKMMKRQAIDRIIQYAAVSDLRLTKHLIGIIHIAIDGFFDFVLVTNRRSVDEWGKLRDEALEWGDTFFKLYRHSADKIVRDTNQRLPERFHEKRDEIKEKAFKDFEERGYKLEYEPNKEYPSKFSRLFSLVKLLTERSFHGFVAKPGLHFVERSTVGMLVEREVIKPVLQQITFALSNEIKNSIDNKTSTNIRNKNELLHVAYRELLVDIGDFGNPDRHSIETIIRTMLNFVFLGPFRLPSLSIFCSSLVLVEASTLISGTSTYEVAVLFQQRILDSLKHMENNLGTMGDTIKTKLVEWIDIQHKKFRNKVNGCYKIVCCTIADRYQAYELARSFAPQFARIECLLQANLDLDTHHGSTPIIEEQILGTGGFFTVHPASWDSETELVAKKLRHHITNPAFAYLEAHFHRTVTRLNIPNMIQLKYLYEDNNSSLYLLLPRYATDLHSFLKNNMKTITADKAIKISHDIAHVIAHMHAHDLVHRDIKVQNILVDKYEQVYLADFGTCQHGTDNETFIGSRPLAPDLTTASSTSAASSSSSRQYSYEGSAVDVYSLGVLMYACAPKDSYIAPTDNIVEQLKSLNQGKVPKRYYELMTRCISKNPKERPTAKEIVDELELMAEKLCIVCYEAARAVRFEPCGHNALCFGCFERIRQNPAQTQCIICKQTVTGIREDNDSSTFIQLR